MGRISTKEWCRSRGIDHVAARKIISQLKTQYVKIAQTLRGEPVPDLVLELELVQLVHDVQQGRFPVKSYHHRAQE